MPRARLSRLPRLYVIDLFSGTGSVSRALKRAFANRYDVRVESVDIHPGYNPTSCVDIITWNYRSHLDAFLKQRRPHDVVVVHASPPCVHYSRAKTLGRRDLTGADAIVQRSLRIMKYARPDYWTMENPVGLLRTRPFMQRLRKYRNTCSYCRYGKPIRKNTDIWTNIDVDLKCCNSQTPCPAKAEYGRHPVTAQSGPSGHARGSGVRENVYSLPAQLTTAIYKRALTYTR